MVKHLLLVFDCELLLLGLVCEDILGVELFWVEVVVAWHNQICILEILLLLIHSKLLLLLLVELLG